MYRGGEGRVLFWLLLTLDINIVIEQARRNRSLIIIKEKGILNFFG